MAPRRFTVLLAATMLAAVAGCGADSGYDSGPVNAPAGGKEGNQYSYDQPEQGIAPPAVSGETDASRDPQSTFALDVDTASYTYAARQISDGKWPDRAAVRPEEFVNAFDARYPQPRGDGFAVHVDGSAMPKTYRDPGESSDVRLLRIGLATRGEDAEGRKDAALTFVIDVSGSMSETGRLDLVQDALHTLVNELRPTDSVAIVAFNDKATTVREMTRVSDGEKLHTAIDALEAGGSTNLESGLVQGYRVARDGFRSGITNRVIILSDGLANVGNTKADPMLRKIREEADKEIALLGVGVGSQYGDSLMERLADKGDGFVVYVANRTQARDVFVHKLPATLSVRALDAKAQVTFDQASVEAYRLVGYEDRRIADSNFRNDRVDGGEVGPGHSVTALYIVRLRPEVAASARVAEVRVRWLDPRTRQASETYDSISAGDLRGSFDTADAHLRIAFVAAFFAEALKASKYGLTNLQDLAAIADRANQELNDRKVDELITTIDLAQGLRR
ncbi:Ca-activated chloride channel family protein [Allocatelliglobosispora scoriae]|uniref:Ca-activated chloride channel family protein n=1 Tax=Allocatelliglobosispora scoriae TaxID=643052 RepID=A0A841BUZ1_9ACTN|nr:von Willebrand factor type A domain-containing protein [Allocatelliglobosispora scoriae]MBB5870979.1 Ca-activated chloride channel family protein [Allocatelliglobosispora scoriae]